MLTGELLGMDIAAAYTPLECLLVFQSLAALGTDEEDFINISELLKKSPFIRNCPSFDAKRLEANALRELYLGLIQDELRSEESDGLEESNQPPSRKRKLLTSKVASVNDHRQYKHKLPLLVERLFTRYRDYMIKAIEEDERKYLKIQGQIEQIERGDWDEKILDKGERQESSDKNLSLNKKNGLSSESPKSENALLVKKDFSLNQSSAHETKSRDILISNVSNGTERSLSKSQSTDNTQTGSKNITAPRKKILSPLKLPLSKPSTQSRENSKWGSTNGNSGQVSPLQQNLIDNKSARFSPQIYTGSSRGSFPESPVASPQHSDLPSSPATISKYGMLLSPSTGVGTPGILSDSVADTASLQNRITSGSMSNSLKNDPSKSPDSSSNSKRRSPPPVNSNSKLHLTSRPLLKSEKKQYSSPYNKGQILDPITPKTLSIISSNLKKTSRSSVAGNTISHEHRRSITGSGTSWKPNPVGFTPPNFTPLPSPQVEPLSPVSRPTTTAPSQITKKKHILKHKIFKTHKKSYDCSFEKPGLKSSTDVSKSNKTKLFLAEKQNINKTSEGNVNDKQTPKLQKFGEDNSIPDEHASQEISKSLLSPSRVNKRKRENTSGKKSRPPSTVLWTRAFPKIAAQALQDISTDKNASMFANPIKEKDAPGYRNVILRPQDLKSIRSAITAGHRAAMTAAPADLSPSVTSVWLPICEELVPPRGIINYAQLEKELMRMFANAIMFNADPRRGLGPVWQDAVERSKEEAHGYSFDEDSVVKGTRDMFAAVEKKVSDLRSVERRNEKSWNANVVRDQVDEEENDSACSRDSSSTESESKVKRRRKI